MGEMGRATRWLRSLLGGKKDTRDHPAVEERREKKRWRFGKSGRDSGGGSGAQIRATTAEEAAWLSSVYSANEKEQNKNAIADAAVAAAHAAVAVVNLTSQGRCAMFGAHERLAAVKIQTVFRGFLFPPPWMKWIEGCMDSTMLSIIVYGKFGGCFSVANGVRQWDSISPYLFVLAMETLSKLLVDGLRNNEWSSFKDRGTSCISHLLFADDILIFAKASDESVDGLMSILKQFEAWYGMMINKEKSIIFLSKSVNRRSISSKILGIPLGLLPIRYLGIPLNSLLNKILLFHEAVDMVRRKLDTWTNKL